MPWHFVPKCTSGCRATAPAPPVTPTFQSARGQTENEVTDRADLKEGSEAALPRSDPIGQNVVTQSHQAEGKVGGVTVGFVTPVDMAKSPCRGRTSSSACHRGDKKLKPK